MKKNSSRFQDFHSLYSIANLKFHSSQENICYRFKENYYGKVDDLQEERKI